jgi:hypothetical protein
MLSPEEIQRALHASRVVPVSHVNPHGPLGLEHLAAIVARIQKAESLAVGVQRPLTLPREVWDKLDQLARAATAAGAPPVSPSAIAAALIEESVAAR